MDIASSTLITKRLPGLSRHTQAPQWLGQPGHCLVLDAALCQRLRPALYAEREAHGWAVEPLYLGTSLQALANSGPHLVQVWDRAAVLDEAIERMQLEPLGITLLPARDAAWEALCHHCRRWLTPHSAEGAALHMRWFDPRWIRALLSALPAAHRPALTAPWQAIAWWDGAGWYCWEASQPTETGESRELPVFDAALLAALDAERLWDSAAQLVHAYHTVLTIPREGALLRGVHAVLEQAVKLGLTEQALQERWFRLAVTRGASFCERSAQATAILSDTARTPLEKLALLEALPVQGPTA